MLLNEMGFPCNGVELTRTTSIVNICKYNACKFSGTSMVIQGLLKKGIKVHTRIMTERLLSRWVYLKFHLRHHP